MKKYLELYISFFKIGIMTFGGGLAMLPMLTREVLDHRGWATEEELMDYYAIGQCTPGIIAVNVATFIGRKEGGWAGAAAATLGMISPSILIITAIAAILLPFMGNAYVVHALAGIRITVCALVLNSVIRLARKSILDLKGGIMAVLCLVLALFTEIPTAVIVLFSGAAGIFLFGSKKEEEK